MNRKLHELNRSEIKEYIFNLQSVVQEQKLNYENIDDFLDNTDIFDKFEEILADQEFGVLILTVLNNFKSKIIIDDILDIIEQAIKKENRDNE